MFIDIHVHTNSRPAPLRAGGKATYATPEYLMRRYQLLGIETAVILPGTCPECAHQVQSAEEALDICHRHPGSFVTFCNVHPRMASNSPDADLGSILAYYKSLGCKGCGEATANLAFDDPLMENLFRACEQHSMPLTFHIAPRIGGCYGLYDDPGLPRLEQALRNFPKLTFLGHSQPFWAEISTLEGVPDRNTYPAGPVTEGRVVQLMRTYPNLHGDLSAGSGHNAVSRDEAFGVRFLEEFQDRLYFGTDICHPDTPTPLVDYLLHLRDTRKISEDVFCKVARENAVRLLGLDT